MARFRSPKDIAFFNRIAGELIENLNSEKITYYPISKQFSTTDFYNESKEKIVDPPIDVYAVIGWLPQEIVTNQFGHDIRYNLTAFILESYMIEISLKPREGDFVEYDDRFFEITKIEEPRQVFAKEGHRMGVKLTCTSVRESQFKITVSGSAEHQSRTAPDDPATIDTFYDNVLFPFSGS